MKIQTTINSLVRSFFLFCWPRTNQTESPPLELIGIFFSQRLRSTYRHRFPYNLIRNTLTETIRQRIPNDTRANLLAMVIPPECLVDIPLLRSIQKND